MGEQANRAREDAAAVAALAEQLRVAQEAYKSLADAEQARPLTRIQAAKAAVAELGASYKALAAAQKEAERAEQKRAKDDDRRAKEETKRQKDQQRQQEQQEKSAREERESLEEGGAKAGDKIRSGAEAAAITILAAAIGITTAVTKLGVESTAAADKQRRSFGYLTRAYGEGTGKGRGVVQGDLAYRVTLALGAEKGVTPDVALDRMRRLIDAKFSREKAELIFRVSADIGAVKGEGKAEELLGQLEAVKRLDQKVKDARDPRNKRALEFERGQAQTSALDKFAEAGIKSSEVLGILAQKGEGLRHVSLRLRRGKIDADDFAAAVTKVAGKDFTGAAGHGLDATINRAKIGITSLFEGWDLSPIEEAGSKLDEALRSPEGAELKRAIAEIGRAALDVFKNISKEDISSVFVHAAGAARSFAEAIRVASAIAGDLVGVVKDIGKATGIIGEVGQRQKTEGGFVDADGKVRRTANVEAEDAGKSFDDGLIKGIDANLDKVKAAGARAGLAAASGSAEELGIRSPSRVAMEQGGDYGKGYVIGIDSMAPRVAGAAARLAGGASRAGGAAGGPSFGGASGGGVSISLSAPFSPQITLSSASQEDLRRVESLLVDFYAGKFLPFQRQALRDARELATGGG